MRYTHKVRKLTRDPEVWHSFDDAHALRFRMKCKEGAVVCVVSQQALLRLPGVPQDSDEETLLVAFETHLPRFEELAEAKYADGDIEDGEIRIHHWDFDQPFPS